MDNFDGEMLSVWDSQLVKYGNVCLVKENILVNELIPVFREYYSLVSNGKEKVRLKYRSHLSDGDFR